MISAEYIKYGGAYADVQNKRSSYDTGESSANKHKPELSRVAMKNHIFDCSGIHIIDTPTPGDWYVGEFVPKIAEACAAVGCKLVNTGQVEGFVSKGDGTAIVGALVRWEVQKV